MVRISYKNCKTGEMCQRRFFYYDDIKDFLQLLSDTKNLQLETITETKLCDNFGKTSEVCIYRRVS